MSETNETGTETTVALRNVTDDELREIDSFDAAMLLINSKFGGNVIDIGDELGTGFAVGEKDHLIGLGFVVLEARRNLSDRRDDEGNLLTFWSLTVVTSDNRKVIINDGGTGIAKQCDALLVKHVDGFVPLVVSGGLRKSTYNHPTQGPSTTYYLATDRISK